MCSRNVKRPARGAGLGRAAGCRLKGARNVSPAPHPAPHRRGHERRQQRVTRGSGRGTSWQANAAGRPCADRTSRPHSLTDSLRHDGTDQGIPPCGGILARGLAAVARHPFGRPGGDRPWVPRPPVRSITRWQRSGPGGPGMSAGSAPSRPHRRPVGTQRDPVPDRHRGSREAATRAASRQNYLIKRGRPRPGGRAGVAARSRSGCGRQNRLPEKHRCK